MECMGRRIHEVDIKNGLARVIPDINFDMGARLDIVHPMMNVRQGVFVRGRHITSMDRGMIPENQITVKDPVNRIHRNDTVWRVGWRKTFDDLVNHGCCSRRELYDTFDLPPSFLVESPKKILITNKGEEVA